jgi:hypothetical protein
MVALWDFVTKKYSMAGYQLLVPVILATQEAKISRIMVQRERRQANSSQDPISKIPNTQTQTHTK